MLAVVSQRVFSSGLRRLCSIATAAVNNTMKAISAQPIQRASNHHTVRPSASTAHRNATPGANSAKVTKSIFSKLSRGRREEA